MVKENVEEKVDVEKLLKLEAVVQLKVHMEDVCLGNNIN
jgi:hypothetical protein